MGRRDLGLLIADSIITGVFTAPLTIGFWRGTFGLMDLCLFPDNLEYSGWCSYVMGAVIFYSLAVIHPKLTELFYGRHWLVWLIVYHLHTYAMGFAVANIWRGSWGLWNHYFGKGLVSSIVNCLAGLIPLLLMRASKNIWGPPFACAVDTGPDYFTSTTRFRTKPSDREKYMLDHLWTHWVCPVLNCFSWRGIWLMADNLLVPEDIERSSWWSIGIGYIIYVIWVPLQFPMRHLSRKLEDRFLLKLAAEDLFHLIGNAASVLIWRGIWIDYVIYLWPDRPLASNALTHFGGIGILMLMFSANSVIMRGCEIDGSLKNGEGMMLCNVYLRYYFPSREEVSDEKDKENKLRHHENGDPGTPLFPTLDDGRAKNDDVDGREGTTTI